LRCPLPSTRPFQDYGPRLRGQRRSSTRTQSPLITQLTLATLNRYLNLQIRK
jgi:hypothetical protein